MGDSGIAVETVEIKSVRISRQLFENLQAPFRNALRLESEHSAIETNSASPNKDCPARAARPAETPARNPQDRAGGVAELPHEAELTPNASTQQGKLAGA